MDVFRLDPESYTPEDLIEGLHFKSWVERYRDFGEFEFRSSRIDEVREALPENCLVGIRESDAVMLVETHTIDQDGENGDVLVVKGRSAHVILESRAWAGAKYGKKAKMRQKYSIQNAIMVYLVNCLRNYNGVDLVSKSATAPPNELDIIPNLRIVDGTTTPLPSKTRYVENMQSWSYIYDMLGAGKFGLRTLRPIADQEAKKTVHVTNAGVVSKPLETTDGLTMEVYNGVDRTDRQVARPQVVFAAQANHLTDPTYIFSSEKYKSVALVISASGPVGKGKEVERIYENEDGAIKNPIPPRELQGGVTKTHYAPGEPNPYGRDWTPKGFDRRVLLVDAGSKDDDDTTAEFLASLPDIGSDALKAEYERISSVDGTISATTPYVYKTHYDLGDKVTLLGRYGVSQDMQVQEYARIQDKEGGERGIPGLVLWTE